MKIAVQNLFLTYKNKNGMRNTHSYHQKDVVIAEIDAKTREFKEKGEIVMAKKTTKKEEEVTPVEEKVTPVEEKKKPETKKGPKYAIGSVVFISKDADTDLEGFKLFPQYKKYAYTVEAYNDDTGVYSLRRLNLSLKLKETFIINPDERAHDTVNRRQF